MAGALLWIVAAVLGLVAVVLCITVILLGCHCWASRAACLEWRVRLMLPREVAHPAEQTGKRLRGQIDDRVVVDVDEVSHDEPRKVRLEFCGIERRHGHSDQGMAGDDPTPRTAAAPLHTVLAALKGSGSHPARRRDGKANDSRQLQFGTLAFERVLDLIGFRPAVVVDTSHDRYPDRS